MHVQEVQALEGEMPALTRYACALTNTRDTADDLVQESLTRAISHLNQFTPGTNLRAWLFTILRNVHRDQQRRNGRRGTAVPIEDWEHELRSPASQMQNLEVRDFRQAFARLSKEHQEVVLLVGLQGYSYEEAAAALGVKIGTIRSRLSRARERLRELDSAPGPGTDLPKAA